jgi:predicted Zn-dependent peptidase
LSANLPAALDLVADMILRPRYGAADVKRERTLAIGSVKLGFEDPVTVASRLGAARWFGEGHPYARPPEGTPSGLARLGKKDVLSYHRRAWSSAGATLTLAGDLTMDAAIALLEPRLGAAWPAGDGARVSVPPASPATGKVFLVDRPGSAQTMFYLVFAAPPAGDPRSPAARNGTIVLGGTFTSRLNALLREKRGYTYGARARLSQMPGAGVYVISTRIRTDATGPAMTDLLAELGSLRAGVTAAEVAKARSAFRQDVVETMSSRAGIAEAYAELHAAGLPPDAFSADLRSTGALAPADVAPTLGAYDVAAGVVVLVGDRAAIEAPLRAAGVGTIEVVAPY